MKASVWFLAILLVPVGTRGESIDTLSLSADDRLLVLAPHPDDDILCCAGILQEAVTRHLAHRIVYFTYGDNYEWAFMAYKKHPVLVPSALRAMGLLRHDEATAAEWILGVSPSALTFLGYPDYGTLPIWLSHWGETPPFRSMLTRATAVPYANARRPGTPYRGEEIVKDLSDILKEFRPTKIFVSHPEDHHPDHRSLPLFLTLALKGSDPLTRSPSVYHYLVHAKGWPEPRQALPEQPLSPPIWLAPFGLWRSFPLSPQKVYIKTQALSQHRTQFRYDHAYLSSFLRANELFAELPPLPLRPISTRPGKTSRGPPIETEPAAWLGLEHKRIGVENGNLVLTVNFSRPLAPETRVDVFAFGDRPDRPFSAMPKICVQSGSLRHHLFDRDQPRPWSLVRVERRARSITLWIPLALLGNPDRVFASARSRLVFPMDGAAWHILKVENAGELKPTAPVRRSGPKDTRSR